MGAVRDQLAADHVFRRGVHRLHRGHRAVAQVEDGEFARSRDRRAARSWSPGRARPAICSLRSYWSDQNHGTSPIGRGLAHHRERGVLGLVDGVLHAFQPDAVAFAPDDGACSRRRRRSPDRRCAQNLSTTMPSSQSRPASCASSPFGTMPMPTSAMSAAIDLARPRARRRACSLPSKPSTPVLSRSSTPASRWTLLVEIRHRLETARAITRSIASNTVTSRSYLRATAATSRPI